MVKIVVPELGEGITKATVTFWYYQPGDYVEQGQDVVELATDKATFNVSASCSGILSEIFFREGESVGVGEVLGIIKEE